MGFTGGVYNVSGWVGRLEAQGAQTGCWGQAQCFIFKMSERIAGYKNRGVLKQDELRRRREDVAVEIRKQKKEESLAKRRNFAEIRSESDDEPTMSSSIQDLPAMGQGVHSADIEEQLLATAKFRKILSKG